MKNGAEKELIRLLKIGICNDRIASKTNPYLLDPIGYAIVRVLKENSHLVEQILKADKKELPKQPPKKSRRAIQKDKYVLDLSIFD